MSMVTSSSRAVVPDEGNGPRGVAETGLEESAAHNLVRYHQGCQGLTEYQISPNETPAALEPLTGSSIVRGRL